VVIGQDASRLKATEKQAMEHGAASVSTIAIDVRKLNQNNSESNQFQRESLKDILTVQGCDLLINAVGKSDRGWIAQMTDQELSDQFGLNVLSAHATTQFCWSALCKSRGVVVNIASLAGIVAGPGMGGYSMAKHALVGLHRQWRLESESSGVHFLLVNPGPIARDHSLDRYADLIADRNLDPSSGSPGGGVSLKKLDPDDLSKQILSAAARRKLELVVPGKVRLLAMLAAIWPSLSDKIIRNKMPRSGSA
jgi:short-subunit dehydrogenase